MRQRAFPSENWPPICLQWYVWRELRIMKPLLAESTPFRCS